MIKTLFDGNEIPKERIEYVSITCISADSVLKVDKKNYPRVYLERCKYKIKKREMKRFIDDYETDLDSDYECDESLCFVKLILFLNNLKHSKQ